MQPLEQSSLFWMNGRLARGVVEISHDPSKLEEDGFWAVQVDFEGRWTLTKFENITYKDFPTSDWEPVDSTWNSSHTRDEYVAYVSQARDAIARGDFYQVNACRILSAEYEGVLNGLFTNILKKNPSPYACYLQTSEQQIASASPEIFLDIRSDEDGVYVETSPIKGTSKTSEFGEKDQAENIMIVDLMRNDLLRICDEDSIAVTRLLGVEKHPGLFHLVSDVVGKLREDFAWKDFAKSVLPAGSISGAPKSSALKFIQENEGVRGPYCGLIGWIEKNGKKITGQLSVGIRLFWLDDYQIHFGSGAGITWGSDPVAEWEETELKARRLISIASGKGVE